MPKSSATSGRSIPGRGRLYAEDRLIRRYDPVPYRKDILATLDELSAKAEPDDLVVVFLAGHGDFVDNPDTPKGSEEKEFVFCCPNYDRSRIKETGIRAKTILDKLAACKGRKLILVDACHSGQGTTESVIRHLVPEGQGPIVIAACDQKEVSFEDPKLGHGLFTKAVLDALGDKFDAADGAHDKKKDGVLDPQELFDYVRRQLPELLKQAGKKEWMQNPQAYPVDLARFPIAAK